MLKKSVFAASLLISTTANAAGWSNPLTIEELWSESSTDIVGVTTTGGSQYSNNCLANYWLINANTDNRRDRIYSTLLAAQMAGKKVRIWYSDNCTSWNYHEGTIVKILKQNHKEMK